jgi:hypothetical protein
LFCGQGGDSAAGRRTPADEPLVSSKLGHWKSFVALAFQRVGTVE